ncbi:MAG: T9SS type A sorting domain-containing protein [bacterium]
MKKLSLAILICFISTIQIFAQWTNGMDAEYVIGQPDFQTNTAGVSASSFDLPYDVSLDIDHGKMYVVDLVNHRVLRFNYPITGNQPAADLVFGQPDMTSNGPNRNGTTAANTLFYPTAVAVYSGALWICDQANHRILKFSDAASLNSNGPNADVVLGQPDFTSSAPGTVQNKFFSPYDITFDWNGNLWVADMSNNRILRFDNASNKSNGANADGVLGQTNFTNSFPATSQSGMMGPSGVSNFEGNLFVADMANNRVIRFKDALQKANGANADGVLGQDNYTSGEPNKGGAAGQSTLNQPFKVEHDRAGRLYVSDQLNRRCLIFYDAMSKGNGANANHVLGQVDFSNTTPNAQQNIFSFPNGAVIDNFGNKLIITDEENNRVLQFSSISELIYNSPESVVYDYENNWYIISNAGDGKLITKFSSGYFTYFNEHASTSIRGITIYNSQLYAACDEGVKVFDILSGTNSATYPIAGSLFLNDIAVDSDGNIFVSDDGGHKVYKLDAATHSVSMFADMGTDNPNGLYVDEANNRLIVLCWAANAPIRAVDLTTAVITDILITNLNFLDGITTDTKGNFYISAWGEAAVYKFNQDFTIGPELIFEDLAGPADIFYDTENNVLAIPLMGTNDVEFLQMPGIKLTKPNGGEIVDAGSVFNIEWESSGIENIKIEYSTNNGTNWIEIIAQTGADGSSFAWTVPNTPSVNCLVKLTDVNDATNIDESDAVFTVQTPVSVEDEEVIHEFYLSQNYPNPFNPTTRIKYSIPSGVETPYPDRSGHVMASLRVYDILGNEIATLVNERKEPGYYEVEFDASHLASGVYFYKLTAGSFSSAKKLLLLK